LLSGGAKSSKMGKKANPCPAKWTKQGGKNGGWPKIIPQKVYQTKIAICRRLNGPHAVREEDRGANCGGKEPDTKSSMLGPRRNQWRSGRAKGSR